MYPVSLNHSFSPGGPLSLTLTYKVMSILPNGLRSSSQITLIVNQLNLDAVKYCKLPVFTEKKERQNSSLGELF